MTHRVVTGHKTFDRQTDCLTHGNIVSRTLYGNYIRPRQMTTCNNASFPPGALQNFDLDHAIFDGMPRHVRALVTETADKINGQVILYRVFHRRRRKRIDHGWIVTHSDERGRALIGAVVTGSRHKSFDVVQAVADFLAPPQSAHDLAAAARRALMRTAATA